jgi:hypothetical protein
MRDTLSEDTDQFIVKHPGPNLEEQVVAGLAAMRR